MSSAPDRRSRSQSCYIKISVFEQLQDFEHIRVVSVCLSSIRVALGDGSSSMKGVIYGSACEWCS